MSDTMQILLGLGGLLYVVVVIVLPFVIWSAANSARRCADRLETIEKHLVYKQSECQKPPES